LEEVRKGDLKPEGIDVESVDPLLTPIASVGRKIFHVFEHEVGMIPPMYFMLHAVASEDGISQAELSRLFEVVPTRVTRLAQKMETDGFIRRERDPKDNRVVRLYLTPDGREAFEHATGRHRTFSLNLQKALNYSERKELQRLLAKLLNTLDGLAEASGGSQSATDVELGTKEK
jgi:DNA-binding MarR family transcriptional regulator